MEMLNNKEKLKSLYKAKPELINEHKRLVNILRSGTPEEQKKEAEKQLKELKEMLAEEDNNLNKTNTTEKISFNNNGQWVLEKSNYGPKEMGLYNPLDNVNRKKTRTGEEIEGIGRNKAVRRYTSASMGTASQQASTQAKKDKIKSSKNPVRSLKDLSQEEIGRIMEAHGIKKEDKISPSLYDLPIKDAISQLKSKYSKPDVATDSDKIKSIKQKYSKYTEQ
jgi:hypothetical protein